MPRLPPSSPAKLKISNSSMVAAVVVVEQLLIVVRLGLAVGVEAFRRNNSKIRFYYKVQLTVRLNNSSSSSSSSHSRRRINRCVISRRERMCRDFHSGK